MLLKEREKKKYNTRLKTAVDQKRWSQRTRDDFRIRLRRTNISLAWAATLPHKVVVKAYLPLNRRISTEQYCQGNDRKLYRSTMAVRCIDWTIHWVRTSLVIVREAARRIRRTSGRGHSWNIILGFHWRLWPENIYCSLMSKLFLHRWANRAPIWTVCREEMWGGIYWRGNILDWSSCQANYHKDANFGSWG